MMKEKNSNRARTVIAFALIVILAFSAVGNIGRLLFGPVVKTAVHEANRDFSREFSQQDWDQFGKEMESLGDELGTMGEELGQELEQLGEELDREFESTDVQIHPEINTGGEVGR